ncbi:acetylglutamate kinase [Cytobacillus depressus]|uniref:Acetylglutamate kinase n=1 Tax=Cytobacillus depressus TaxID=1602942 RepID=A0A6L3VAJ4_9BACI|nr:acetylglutamate kinase [Cytobacillus depressus]KAB2338089.1 acetylglutamate kinase [Cytobacillus depressus]
MYSHHQAMYADNVRRGIIPHYSTASFHPNYRANLCVSKAEMDLNNFMRLLWEEHIAWTRMAIISIVFKLPDKDFVIKRLFQNATDMGNAFRKYYGAEIGDRFGRLIREHLILAADLVTAAAAGDAKAAAIAEKKWYANADKIGTFMNTINPNWPVKDVREMFYEHLRLTKLEAVYMINKNFAADIAVYDQIQKQALGMADVFTSGIIKQFPAAFQC